MVYFEDLFDIGSTGIGFTHDPKKASELPVQGDIANLVWCHQKLAFKMSDSLGGGDNPQVYWFHYPWADPAATDPTHTGFGVRLLPGTVRGPINQMDMTTYYAGAPGTTGYKSTKLKWKNTWLARNKPELLPNNYDKCYYGATVLPSIGHQDAKVAVYDLGMPGPYDNGPQRCGILPGLRRDDLRRTALL